MSALASLFLPMLFAVGAGVPVFLAMAFAVLVFALVNAPLMPALVVVQGFQRGLDSSAFTAIPYFFLAGALMNAGGASHRLLRLARALVAQVRGGLAHVNIVASVVFAGASGSAVADAAAVGSVIVPAMKRDGYPGAYAAAVTASSATIGVVVPPSIPMVIYALFTGTEIGALFLAGIVPGLMMGLFLVVTAYLIARRRGHPALPWQGRRELAAAAKGAALPMLLPVIVVAGLVFGFATASEIGAIAVLYALVLALVVHRDAPPRALWTATVQAALDSARVLIVIAISGAFVWIVARLGLATEIAAFLTRAELSPTLLLLAVAAILLVLGTVLEPTTILVVVVPVLVPAALVAGIDLVHLGVVVVLATAMGLVTPPVGVLLYLTAAQAGAPALEVVRESLPFLAALALLLLALILAPPLVLWLPGLL